MKEWEVNTLKGIRNGLCLFLVAGMAACYGGREVVEDDVLTEGFAITGDTTAAELGVTEKVAVADDWDMVDFYTTFTTTLYYEDWDVDNNRFLDEDEFTASFFQIWDTDGDGMVEEIEWDAAASDFGLNRANWVVWDTNDDDFIDAAEFGTGFTNLGWYDTWDIDNDGFVEEREYTDGVYTLWDTDGDNVLDETEQRRYDLYYGNEGL